MRDVLQTDRKKSGAEKHNYNMSKSGPPMCTMQSPRSTAELKAIGVSWEEIIRYQEGITAPYSLIGQQGS